MEGEEIEMRVWIVTTYYEDDPLHLSDMTVFSHYEDAQVWAERNNNAGLGAHCYVLSTGREVRESLD